MTLRFADFLTLEAFVLHKEYRRRYPFPQELLPRFSTVNRYQSHWSTVMRDVRHALISRPVIRYLQARHAQGLIYPIDNGQGRHTTFTDSWQEVLNGKESAAITKMIAGFVDFHDKPTDDPIAIRGAWVQLCREIDGGNFEWDQLAACEECDYTDEMLYIEFENWRPYYSTYKNGGVYPNNNTVRAPQIPPFQMLRTLDITFKTSDILITDWCDVGKFSRITRLDAHMRSSAASRIARTEWYTHAHGFVSLYTGHASQACYRRIGDVTRHSYLFGWEEENNPGFDQQNQFIGEVRSGRWSTTIIEIARLHELANPENDPAIAQEIGAYLRECSGFRLQIEPGDYQFKYCPDYTTFNHHATQAGEYFHEMLTPTFTMRKK